MKKRILSIVLTLCMLLSVVPMMSITASAAEEWCNGCLLMTEHQWVSDGDMHVYKCVMCAMPTQSHSASECASHTDCTLSSHDTDLDLECPACHSDVVWKSVHNDYMGIDEHKCFCSNLECSLSQYPIDTYGEYFHDSTDTKSYCSICNPGGGSGSTGTYTIEEFCEKYSSCVMSGSQPNPTTGLLEYSIGLTDNISLDKPLEINHTCMLALNGASIGYPNATNAGSVIVVDGGSTLNIDAAQQSPSIQPVTVNGKQYYNAIYGGGGTKGNDPENPEKTVTFGGGICSKGNLYINGSVNIVGNSAYYGGGIFVAEGIGEPNFMFGAVTIADNSAIKYGGGLYLSSNSTISFGKNIGGNAPTISGNKANQGAAIFTDSSAYCTLDSVTITDNTTAFRCFDGNTTELTTGAVHGCAQIIITGAVTIKGNVGYCYHMEGPNEIQDTDIVACDFYASVTGGISLTADSITGSQIGVYKKGNGQFTEKASDDIKVPGGYENCFFVNYHLDTGVTRKIVYNATGEYYAIAESYKVTCATCTNGSVSVGTNDMYAQGETVTVTPTANSGYAVDKVYYNDGTQHEITPSSGVYSFTMPGKAVTVSATFAEAKTYVCYIDKNENGTFDGSDVKYESVSDAVEAVGGTENEIGSGVIILLDNTSDNITVGFYQGITIDLNGKTLSAKNASGAVITNDGSLIITDTSANGGNITGGAKGIEHNGFCLTLKGKANITGNTANIYLANGSFVDVDNDGADKFTGTVGFTTETAPTAGSPVAVSAQNEADFAGTFFADNTGLILYSCKTSRRSSNSIYYHILKCGVLTVEGKLNSTTTKTYGSVQDAYNDERAEEMKMIADSEENVSFEVDDVSTATPITLDLNGHILKAADSEYAVIGAGNTVTVKDSNPSTIHTEEDLPNGGVIVGGTHGIEIKGSDTTVSMYGGTITGNNRAAVDGGAGVIVIQGTFNMHGGAICKNTTNSGGGAGVRVMSGSAFNMYNGTISHNVCDKAAGAGVYNDGTFNMYGGKITDNETVRQSVSFGNTNLNGAGVYNNGTMTVGGDAVIANNTNKFNNITSNLYLYGNTITLASGDNALKPGAIIGVTLSSGDGQFTENGDITDLAYFFSDNSDYTVAYNSTNEYLELVYTDSVSADVASAEYYASLTLEDNIDVSIYADGFGSTFNSANCTIYVNGVDAGAKWNGTELACENAAAFAPKNIGKDFSVVLVYDNMVAKSFTYSVKDYCNAVLASSETGFGPESDLGKLCIATLNYGAAADNYFGNKSDSTINAGYVNASLASTVITPKTATAKVLNSTYTDATADLVLGSTTTLKFFVTSSEQLTAEDVIIVSDLGEKITVKNMIDKKVVNDNDNITVSYSGGVNTICVKNINSSRIARSYTLLIKGVEETDFSVTFGAYNYGAAVTADNSGTYSDSLKTLCKAMYLYGEAAAAYAGV